MKWVGKAMENGATLLSVDPRFTRTSAKADFYTALRSGTDIAFLGGMINYIIQNNLYFEEYLAYYTNASFILGKNYSFKDGLFSGYNKKTKSYDKSQWAFDRITSYNVCYTKLLRTVTGKMFLKLLKHTA